MHHTYSSQSGNQVHSAKGMVWGCHCNGHIRNGAGVAMQCRGCDRWFHSRCMKLDYSYEELQVLMSPQDERPR